MKNRIRTRCFLRGYQAAYQPSLAKIEAAKARSMFAWVAKIVSRLFLSPKVGRAAGAPPVEPGELAPDRPRYRRIGYDQAAAAGYLEGMKAAAARSGSPQ